MYIGEYMNTNVITVNSNTPIYDAEKIMHDNRIRRLPVVDKGKLVGIITKDRLREIIYYPAISVGVQELVHLLAKMKVKDVMKEKLFTVTPDTMVEEAVSEAQKCGIMTLLVVDKDKPDKLVGLATTTDLCKVTQINPDTKDVSQIVGESKSKGYERVSPKYSGEMMT